MTGWLTVLALALLTYLSRFLPLQLAGKAGGHPAWLRDRMEYVAPAVLAAVVGPAVLGGRGGSLLLPETLAYGAALLTALLTRRLLPPMVAGLATLALAGWLT